MIKFFQKLRKRLIAEGNLKRYLLYAIGEILLVVIGILIALQINNWNENRITKNIINQVLINLRDDILYDIRFFKNLDSTYSSWDTQAEKIEARLRSRSMDRINTIEEYQIGRGSMNHLSVRTTTFDEMVNTGILFKISNPQISQSINEYYEFAKVEIEKVNLDNQEFYRYVLSTSGFEYINTLSRVYNKAHSEYMDWAWLMDPKSERYMKFESRLSFHREAMAENKLVLGQLLEKADNVLKVIDANISSK